MRDRHKGLRIHGRVAEVSLDPLGAALVGDHLTGATTLFLNGVSDFEDDDEGQLYIVDPADGTEYVLGYGLVEDAVDDESETLILDDPLPIDLDDDSFVGVYPKTSDRNAHVDPGDDVGDDLITVHVPRWANRRLYEGVRPRADQEAVTIELTSGGSWRLVELETTGDDEVSEVKWEDGDGRTLTADDIAAGTAVVTLTHVPLDKSMEVNFGIPQAASTGWVVDAEAQTVTVTLPSWAKEGRRIGVHYQYVEEVAYVDVEPDEDVDIPAWVDAVTALGPIQWLRMDHTGGSTNDSSGFARGCSSEGHFGTAVAGATADGNPADSLSGSSEWISFNLDGSWIPLPDEEWSVAVFYKTSMVGIGTLCSIRTSAGGAGTTVNFYIGEAGAGILSAETWDTSADVVDGSTSNDNTYHFGVLTFDPANDTLTLYRDGVFADDAVQNTTYNTTVRTLQWGTRRTGSATWDRFFAGSLDECLLFDFCLTAEQVATLYAAKDVA